MTSEEFATLHLHSGLTEEQRERAKARAAPFLLLLLAEMKHVLEIKKVVLEALQSEVLDVNGIYDRIWEADAKRDGEYATAVLQVHMMLLHASGASLNGMTLDQWKMRQSKRRRRDKEQARADGSVL